MYTIESVDIILTNSDDTTQSFYLQAPTAEAENRFQYGFRKLTLQSNYRDRNLILRRGYEYYQFIALFTYNWHRMDPRPLVSAKNIALKIPPPFEDTANYQIWNTRLQEDEISKDFLAGVAVGSDSDIDANTNDRNPVPSGSLTLTFLGIDSLHEADLLATPYYHPIL